MSKHDTPRGPGSGKSAACGLATCCLSAHRRRSQNIHQDVKCAFSYVYGGTRTFERSEAVRLKRVKSNPDAVDCQLRRKDGHGQNPAETKAL
jgi:hypothetical protein